MKRLVLLVGHDLRRVAAAAPAAAAAPSGARRLHALAREEAVDSALVHTQDAPDPYRVEATVVDEAPDRLRMDAELARDIANRVEALDVWVDRRHDPAQSLHDAASLTIGRSAYWASK